MQKSKDIREARTLTDEQFHEIDGNYLPAYVFEVERLAQFMIHYQEAVSEEESIGWWLDKSYIPEHVRAEAEAGRARKGKNDSRAGTCQIFVLH